MVVKASEIVIDALEDLVVQQDEAPIEQSEARAAMRMLNDMMLSWDASGINLGYTTVSSMGDEITVPLGAIRAMKANLAIELAPKYEVTPSPALIQRANAGMKAVLNLAVEIGSSAYPSTLPRGSGNWDDGYGDDYYPDEESTILTETGGSIALEEDTET